MTDINNDDPPEKFGRFFDPDKLDHIQAFKTRMATGSWPDKFFPDHLSDEIALHLAFTACAMRWIQSVELKNVFNRLNEELQDGDNNGE